MHPAKAVRRNEMLFGKDICVATSNIVLEGVPVSTGRADVGGQNFRNPNCRNGSQPPAHIKRLYYSPDVTVSICVAAKLLYRQITLTLVIIIMYVAGLIPEVRFRRAHG